MRDDGGLVFLEIVGEDEMGGGWVGVGALTRSQCSYLYSSESLKGRTTTETKSQLALESQIVCCESNSFSVPCSSILNV